MGLATLTAAGGICGIAGWAAAAPLSGTSFLAQAEINKAVADMAYQNQMKMNISEYLHLRQLEIEKEKVELLKDNRNATIIFGNVPPTYPIK